MIRYAYSPKLGHVYYELMPDGELREVEPHVVLAALNAEPPAPVDPADHWSPWLEWRGGPCPLPGDTVFQLHGLHTLFHGACLGNWDNIRRFRYRADNPAGWLPRGEFIPPAELWAPECPVRVEWTPQYIPSDSDRPTRWDHVTHIRLVARQPQAGLPEFTQDEAVIWDVIKGWDISRDGRSYAGATGNDAREIAKAVRAAR